MAEERQNGALPRLGDLFAAEPDRLSRLTFELAGIYFDWSKTHLDSTAIGALEARAAAQGYGSRRDELFAGGIANPSEGRAATHLAERGSGASSDVDLASARRRRMRALVDAIEAGAFGPVTAVLHVGIGGSLLGPALLVDALGRARAGIDVRFVANVDGQAFAEAAESLDPATTLVVAASKTFTTLETRMNLDRAIVWLRGSGVADPLGRVIAITADPAAAVEAGIDESRILPFSEGVGGRYSLWSAVSFSAALALGWDAFESLLEGAAEVDRHVRLAPPDENLALIAAAADRLYVERAGAQSRAVFAYDERLRLLPAYLQQLEMESNGKSVTLAGEVMTDPSAPVTWGGTGTDAQHAVFQLLHQGTATIPVEFVAVREPGPTGDDAGQAQLLLNAFAQGAALMVGHADDDPQRAVPGNRPSATILIDRLDPRSLGALLAFYEHRTFANAVLMGINPFDQFGVELGKTIARGLAENPEDLSLDPSTRALLERTGL